MNSLVSLTPVQGHVNFLNSSFNRLSICGGLIKNELSDLGLKPNLDDFTTTKYFSIAQIAKIKEIWSYQDSLNPTFPQTYYGGGLSNPVPSCKSSKTCFKV
jgi:hypothetical protein